MKKSNLYFAIAEIFMIILCYYLLIRDLNLGLWKLAIFTGVCLIFITICFVSSLIKCLEIEGKDKKVLWFATIILIVIFLAHCSYLGKEYTELQDYCWENQEECFCPEPKLVVRGQMQETEESLEIDIGMFQTCDNWVLIENI